MDFKKILKKMNDPLYQKQLKETAKRNEKYWNQLKEWREITVGATGHRPDKMGGWKNTLGGYDYTHPIPQKIKKDLFPVLVELINKGKTRFVSGGSLGFDTLFFWSVYTLQKKYPHIQNVVAVPFREQDIKWQSKQREWYIEMLHRADYTIDVPRYVHQANTHLALPKDINQYSKFKMNKRNEFIVDQSSVLITYLDLKEYKSGTAQTVRYAQKGYINRPVIIKLDSKKSYEFI